MLSIKNVKDSTSWMLIVTTGNGEEFALNDENHRWFLSAIGKPGVNTLEFATFGDAIEQFLGEI